MSPLREIRRNLPETCRILAVSKLQQADKIRALHAEGQTAFGENYVREVSEKQEALADLDLEWHFIGHLQKNKVRDAVGRFSLIHSVDSLELARALSRRLSSSGEASQGVLLQMNLAGELTKGGFSLAELESSWDELRQMPGLEIRGLMTMPPLFENPEEARPYFKSLRELRDSLAPDCPSLRELSMGTTSDYHVAADEGATWVRLGTLLFGPRETP